jgi:hypothetical protein
VHPSWLVWDQHSLVEAGLINRLTDSAESIEPPLATPTLVEEVPDSLSDQVVGALVMAASKFLVDLGPQIGW